MPNSDYTDSGRKGAPTQTRAAHSYMFTHNPKGQWMPAYGGGYGTANDEGELSDEVAVGDDGPGR